MNYIKNIFHLLFKKEDCFDKKYGFLLKNGIVKKDSYNEVKRFYFRRIQEKEQA